MEVEALLLKKAKVYSNKKPRLLRGAVFFCFGHGLFFLMNVEKDACFDEKDVSFCSLKNANY